jgi:hypothetical protein
VNEVVRPHVYPSALQPAQPGGNIMAKKSAVKTNHAPLGLVGRAFQVCDNNKVSHQGTVRGQLSERHFLVQYGAAHMQIVDLEEMAKPSWQFFADATHMKQHQPQEKAA